MGAEWLALHLTDRCNLDCSHCLRDPGTTPQDIPLDLVVGVLEQASAHYGIKHVALTGGEPTLHPSFVGVVDAIAARGMTWHMVTNGHRFDRVAAWLDVAPTRRRSLTAVNISLDGATEDTHDAVRGAGSFRQVMAAASTCHALAIPFALQFTVHRKNVTQLEAFGLLASELGAMRINYGMLVPSGTHLDADQYLGADEWRLVAARVQRLSGVLKVPVGLNEGFPKASRFHVCEPLRMHTLHVDVRGRLTMCCMHAQVPGPENDVAGDLREMSLVRAHTRLLDIVRETQRARLTELEATHDEWDEFTCNGCLRRAGKPHWTSAGAAGPGASRERWRGAWAKREQQIHLPIVT